MNAVPTNRPLVVASYAARRRAIHPALHHIGNDPTGNDAGDPGSSLKIVPGPPCPADCLPSPEVIIRPGMGFRDLQAYGDGWPMTRSGTEWIPSSDNECRRSRTAPISVLPRLEPACGVALLGGKGDHTTIQLRNQQLMSSGNIVFITCHSPTSSVSATMEVGRPRCRPVNSGR